MKAFTGKKAFYTLVAGQTVSLLGSGLTRFALMIWAYQKEGTATALALLAFFSCLTYVLASPVAGVVIDKLSRKWIMFIADLLSGMVTAALLILFLNGRLEIWHLYLAEGLSGLLDAFQAPSFFSSMTLLLPKEEFTRSNALVGLAKSAVQIIAPAFASALLSVGNLATVMSVDLLTMIMGLASVLLVRLVNPPQSETGRLAKGDFLHQVRFGFRYIFDHPGLKGILFIFIGINIAAGFTYMSILSPLILAHTGGSQVALGIVQTVMGIGGIAGGLILTIVRTPKKKAQLYVWSTMLSFFVCDFLTAISKHVWSWSAAGFLSELGIPFMVSPYYTLWQEHVPADVQGRVFSVREMVQQVPTLIGYLLGGTLADAFFEPLFSNPNPLSWLVGYGPGAGMSAMFLITGFLGALTGLIGVLNPSIRKLDEEPLVDQPYLPENAL
jgi:MFS family permease